MAGVILAIYFTREEGVCYPKILLRTYIIATALGVLMCMISVAFLGDFWEVISTFFIVIASSVCWISYMIEDSNIKKYKPSCKKQEIKAIVLFSFIFIILLILSQFIQDFLGQYLYRSNELSDFMRNYSNC